MNYYQTKFGLATTLFQFLENYEEFPTLTHLVDHLFNYKTGEYEDLYEAESSDKES